MLLLLLLPVFLVARGSPSTFTMNPPYLLL
jgi:hypothetical protein